MCVWGGGADRSLPLVKLGALATGPPKMCFPTPTILPMLCVSLESTSSSLCRPQPSRPSGILFIPVVPKTHFSTSFSAPKAGERERERCGLSPVSCESQVLSPLDSTNEEPCWGLEGGGQGEARASPPFRFPFRGASCSSRVSCLLRRSGSRRVIPSFSGSPQSLPPPFVSPAWGRQFHPAICQSPDFLPVSRLALYFPHRREPSPCIQLLL